MVSNFFSEFKKSKIFGALKAKNSIFFRFVKLEKRIFSISFLVFLFLALFFSKKFFGLVSIFLSLFFFAFLRDLFFENFLKNPRQRENIFDFLNFEGAQGIFEALKIAKKKKLKEINSSILLLGLIATKNPKIDFILDRLLISKRELKISLLKDLEERKEIEDLIKEALKQAREKGKEKIEISDLISKISERNQIFRDFLIERNLKPDDVKEVSNWADYLEKEFIKSKKFWEWKNLIRFGVLAREWTAGYTILLDKFSFDVTKFMKAQKFRKIFVHQKEIKEMEKILLAPEKNNVLIVGEKGSGRRSMIEALARNLALGESNPQLNFKRVVYLDLQKLVSEIPEIEKFESILDKIFNEVLRAENVILVIDNIHNFVGVERKPGTVEISGILSSYLPSPFFPLIAITDYKGLHTNLEKVPAFLEYFTKIEVSEVSKKETLLILEDRALRLERKYKIFFSFQSLKEIIELSEKYLPQIPFPEKAIEILDEVAISVSESKRKIVLPKDVEKIIEKRTKIPVGEIEEKEREKLLNLEALIHQRIVDQEEAVKEISNALRRARTELKVRKGPIGCFLFLGPTGVGKTETSKALAEIYFGSEKRMIRLDMSEFQKIEDIEKLIGAPGKEGLLTTPVRENPFSLILLDEFEKANLNILNLFLQVFDEGHLTDGLGRKVDFKNTIIIATSNAGYQLIFKAAKENLPFSKMKEKLIDFLVEKGIFRPELLNRFDGIILFKPLSKENLLKICELLLEKVRKKLKEKEIEFLITLPLKEKIVNLAFSPEFGAREMQRVIQDKVANKLAMAILEGKIKRGNKVEIDPQNFELIIK